MLCGSSRMNTRELQDKIIKLKKEKDVCVLAHAYQNHDIWDVADYVGDSFGLSQKAAAASQKTVIMAGVRFMADTVKLLSPEKKVILANGMAGCPMAQQMTREKVLEMKKEYPNAAVVAYINTTSSLKTVADVIVTSSSAVNIFKKIENKEIIFIPDCNLGRWVAEQIPEKIFHFFEGGCPTHFNMTVKDVEVARKLHPEAKLLVHPECRAEVTALADYAGSTTGIMSYAEKSDAEEFIIGTENSIVEHLQYRCPDKKFYALSPHCLCANMKLTTLYDIYNALTDNGGDEIILSEDVQKNARKSIDRMIALG